MTVMWRFPCLLGMAVFLSGVEGTGKWVGKLLILKPGLFHEPL